MVIGYFVIAFVLFFFMYKKYMPIIKERQSETDYLDIVETKEFFIMCLIPFFWLVTIPGVIVWRGLDKLYKKYFEDNNGKPKT